MGDVVAAVSEPTLGITPAHGIERLAGRFHQGLAGAGSEPAQDTLDLREGLFYGREVRRVGRQEEDLAPLASMISFALRLLWTWRLSITTTCPASSVGARKCST